MAKPQIPFFSLPLELRDVIYDMLLPYATLDKYERLQWHHGETAVLYVCRKINGEASRRLYRCLDVFYFVDEDLDGCLNVVPELCTGRDWDLSELCSISEPSSEDEKSAYKDWVMVAYGEGACMLFRFIILQL